jgi:hypothetical protein
MAGSDDEKKEIAPDLVKELEQDFTETKSKKKKAGSSTKGEAETKFLQTMAIWAQGAGDPAREDDEALTGWSARYAENFDREDDPLRVDLAPVLGLPEGTTTEEIVRIADEQEEELIAQLIS